MRLLGQRDTLPPHVQDALDTVAVANDATDKALAAVRHYWDARRANDHARSDAVIDDYQAADEQRTRQRHT